MLNSLVNICHIFQTLANIKFLRLIDPALYILFFYQVYDLEVIAKNLFSALFSSIKKKSGSIRYIGSHAPDNDIFNIF